MVANNPVWLTLMELIFSGSNWLKAEQAHEFDSDLMHAFQAGDEGAFKLVFDQNFRKLLAFAYKMVKSREQAEEIVHDAFLSAWSNRSRIDASVSITPYLFTVTKRLALNSLRQMATSQKAIDELWKRVDNLSNQTEEAVLFHDLQRLTDLKISILPPQQQQIFKLSRHDGLSYEEISEILGISKNTVRNHLSLALKALKKHLNNPNIFILAGFLKNSEKIYNFFHLSLVHLRL